MPTAQDQHEFAGPSAGLLEDLVSIEPITSLSMLHQALKNGHPVLADASAPTSAYASGDSVDGSSHAPAASAHAPTMSAHAAADHLDRFATHTRHLDRHRALELVHLATAVLVLGFRSESSRTALDSIFPAPYPADDAVADPTVDTGSTTGPGSQPAGPQSADTESFCNHAEFVLTTADETTIAASLDSRTGLVRKHIGHALTAYIGTPLLLRAVLEGRLRFNRWESFIRRFSWLPLTSLRAVDVFITTLDPRLSLHQFMRRVSQFIATLTEKPVLAARASQGRRAWVEDLPGGQSILCAKGPTPLVHAHFNEGQALARALVKNQTETLDVTNVQKVTSTADDPASNAANTAGHSSDGSAETSSANSTSADSDGAVSATCGAEGSAASSEHGSADTSGDATANPTADASTDLPPLQELSLDEQRMIQQLTFDTLITARPRTETVLEHATPGTEDTENTDRYRVQVSLPDQATVLRKHATVVVTVPATTLLGLDNRPGMIADSPIPADMARAIAAGSTVWYRILTDPSTGQVLDHVAHTYEPDRATRMSVMSKWQTCTAPGCSRPARHCDIDHGIPFNHDHPELGGRTEPLNLHPLCRRHHQAKTDGLLRMRRITGDEIEWILPLGATSTTSAPALDDGGVLTRMSTGQHAPQTAEAPAAAARANEVPVKSEASSSDVPGSPETDGAESTTPETVPASSDVLTPDEALARVWAEILAEQKRWDDRVEQARERQRNARAEERQRFQAWKDDQIASLQRREEQLSTQRVNLLRARDELRSERTRLAVHRSAIWKHNQQCGAALPSHIPVGSYDLTSSRIEYKTTIVPMHVETFAPRGTSAYSLHVPLEPVRLTGPLARAVIDAASQDTEPGGTKSAGRRASGATSGSEATRPARGDEPTPTDSTDRSGQTDGSTSDSDPQNDPPPF